MNESQNPLVMFAQVTVSWIGSAAAFLMSHISIVIGVVVGILTIAHTIYGILVARAELKLRRKQLEKLENGSTPPPGSLVSTIIAVAILSLLFVGCSTSRSSRTRSAENVSAAHASTIEKSLEAQQLPNVTVSGSSNVVTVAPVPVKATIDVSDSASTRGEASGDTRATFRASFSTWLAVAAAAVALAALLLAWVFWSKLSASGSAADRAVAGAISTVETLAAHVSQTEAAHALSTVRASLEKARGKLKP